MSGPKPARLIRESREQWIEELRESESLYRVVADTLPAAVIFREPSGGVLYANNQATLLTGYSSDEIAGGALEESIDDESRRVWKEALSKGTSISNREIHYTHKDGSKRWMSASCKPLFDAGGVYRGMCVAFQDITDTKRAEEELQRKSAEMEAVFAAFPDIYFRLDCEGIIVDYRAGRGSRLYRPPEAFLGKQTAEVLPPEVGRLVGESVEKARKSNEVVSVEYELPVGRRRLTYQARIAPHGDGVVAVIQDITKRKRAEEALRRAHSELEAACTTQSQFLRSITHDVRTPMTSVIGYARILLEGAAGPINDEQRMVLNRMLVSAETLLRVMDSVLETARLSSGTPQLRTKGATPTRIAENMVHTLYPHAQRKGIALQFHGPETGASGIYDPDKIRMILLNLISNAIKYTSEGGVEVRASATKKGTEIIIVDTGVGIPEDQLVNIFEEFKQLRTRSTGGETGFGLGLSIVSRLVDVIEATLILSTAVGVGTAITLYMPSLAGREGTDEHSETSG